MEGIYDNLQQLPAGWERVKIGDEIEVIRGASPRPKGDPRYFGGSIPWIMISDVTKENGKFISKTRDHVTQKGAEKSRYLKAGTLILSNSATVCVPKILGVDGCIHDGFVAFPNIPRRFDILYLYYFFEFIRPRVIDAHRQGITQVNLNTTIVKNIQVPIASTNEQKRIVAEIEKQFSRLDEAVANLKRVKANLKRYKAAVLKAAVEGKLTEQWRKAHPDVEPASELLKRILADRRAKWNRKNKYKEPEAPKTTELPSLPKSWTWVRWEQIGFSQNGRAFPSKGYQLEGFKLLRPGNLHVSGKVVWNEENSRYLPENWAEEFPEFIVGPHEIIMNLTAQSLKDEFLGRVCLTSPDERCLLNQRLARLAPVRVLPEFVLWVFKSHVFRRFVNDLNTGSLIQHMFTSQLADFVLPLAPLPEQNEIVAEVEQRLSVTQQMDEMLANNFVRSEGLRQAVLGMAFSGKLSADG